MSFKSFLLFILFSVSLFSKDITLVTYNILADECVNPEYYPDNKYLDWDQRFPKLCQKIKEINPEIICLQEVTDTSFEQFRKSFPEYRGSFAQKKSSSKLGVATFCKKKTFKNILFSTIICPGTSNCGKYPVQPILVASLYTNQDEPLTLINTKIKWRKNSEEHPATQNHITCLLNQLPHKKGVIVGDFNLLPDSQHIQRLLEMKLFDVFQNDNVTTCLANEMHQRIDYIFATSDLSVTSISCCTSKEHETLPCKDEPSDHIPLVCRIML